MLKLTFKLSLIFIVFFIKACSTSKTAKNIEEINPRPQWVQQRPITSLDYVGIGMARKDIHKFDFQEIAKRNALSDLVSEISVQVSSNSLLFQIERDNSFREDFKNTIKTESNLEIRDFQVIGTWENDKEYWIYYRLNRETYREQIEAEKRMAGQRALRFYKAAKEAESGNVILAINNYLKSMESLKEFWNETIELNDQGKTIYLATDAYQSLQNLISGIQMQLHSDKLDLNVGNGFSQNLQGAVSLRGQPAPNFPVNIHFPGQNGIIRGILNTNNSGAFSFQISKVNRERNNPVVDLSFRVDDIIDQSLDRRLAMAFLSQLSSWRKVVSLNISPPLVHIKSDEKNLNKRRNSESIKNFLQTELVRRNFRLTDNPGLADVTLTISGNTKPTGVSGDFYTTALDLTIRVLNNTNGLTLFSESITNIRGVQLDHERAGEVAYQRVEQDLRRNTINQIVNAIF